MAQEIEFSVHLTEKDIERASDETTFRWRRCLLPGVAVSLAGIMGLFLKPGSAGLGFAAITVGLILIAWGALMPRLLRRKSVRLFLRTSVTRGQTHYQISGEWFRVTSELGRSELRWSAFLKIKETPGYLGLIMGPVSGHLIPLAALSPNQAAELRQLVRSRIQAPPA